MVIAEKLSARLQLPLETDDLVLFSPPAALLDKVEAAGGRLGPRDKFVKRVAAVGGDTVELTPSGDLRINGAIRRRPPLACVPEPPTTQPPSAQQPATDDASSGGGVAARRIPESTVFVVGDCEARSTDSRSWGPLPVDNVVGRPFVRVWPLERAGAIVDEADLNPFRRAVDRARDAEGSQ